MDDSTLTFPISALPADLEDKSACPAKGCSPRNGFLRRPSQIVSAIGVAGVLGLAIAGWLASAPEISRRSASEAVSRHVSNFVADARFARSEAIRLNASVTMCRVADADAIHPRCVNDGEEGGWEEGWLVFRDTDGDKERSPSEPLLRMQRPLMDSGGIYADAVPHNQIRFGPGGSAEGQRVSFRFRPVGEESESAPQKTVCVDALGMASRFERGDVICG